MFLQKFFSKHQFISIALAVFASVAAVVAFVYGATTIGTNVSVDGTLTVSGSAATSTFSTGGLAVGTSQFVVQQTSGNVGIGTTEPTDKLYIVGNSRHELSVSRRLKIFLGDESTATLHAIDSVESNRHLRLAGNTLRFETGDSAASTFTERLRIIDTGNVGIGETAPGSKLSVSGGATIGASYDTAAAPTNGLIIEGNVGIGTTTPYSRFHVSQGASATTTVNFGEAGSATSKACFNTKNVSGADISFYFNAANTMVVESNLCR